MNWGEILIAVFIHLLVPLAGIGWFVVISRRLRSQGATWGFVAQLAIAFLCWGGVLMILLTALLGMWSGMATLGFFFIIRISPVLMAGIATSLHFTRNPRPEQIRLKRACLSYLGTVGMLAILAMIFSTLA